MNDFAQILEQAGGAQAPPEQAARLRTALGEELRRGAEELGLARSGYGAPVTVAFAAGLAVLPVPAAVRSDPAVAGERAWLLAAAAVGVLVEAGAGKREPALFLLAGEGGGFLLLAAPGADGELAVLAFEEQVAGIDRLRARAVH